MDGEDADLITPPSSENKPSVQQEERVSYQPYRPTASQTTNVGRFDTHTHTQACMEIELALFICMLRCE